MKRLLMFISIFLIVSNVLQAEISVLKLSYASPERVITVLKNLYGRQLEATSAPMINAIIVRTKSDTKLIEIKKLLKSLDRKPAMLRFSISSIGNTQSTNASISFSSKSNQLGNYKTNRITRNNSSNRSITVMEFQKAGLTDSITRVVPLGWQGASTVTANRGLKISGHLADNGNVIVSLWYSKGGFYDSENIITSVSAPIGQWFNIGTNNRNDKSKPSTTELNATNNSLKVTKTSRNEISNQNYRIKVDVISSNY